MKLLSSSSSASSTISTTTTTNSFDGNFYTSKSATAGCIAGVLRRLLCRNSLPTHPADHFREAENESVEPQKLQCTRLEDGIEAVGAPSIVARLMGLESMPQIDKSLNSLARSRSMNSVDSSKDFETIQGRHRRVKSFREIPTYIELEDEKFFILSFENGSKSRKMMSKERKSDKGRRQIKKRREEKNKENFRIINKNETEKLQAVISTNSYVLKDISNVEQNSDVGMEVVKLSQPGSNNNANCEERRVKKKRKDDCLGVNRDEPDIDSQNSTSPNSVLDFLEFPVDREAPFAAQDSRVKNSKSRRTLWEELENYRKLNPCSDQGSNGNDRGPKASGANCIRLLHKQACEGHKHVQIWKQICKLADSETLQSNWIPMKEISKLDDYEKISRDLELHVLDKMIVELVDQLAENLNVNC